MSRTRPIIQPSPSREPSRTDRQFVQGVARAFAVIRCFSSERPALTITDVATRSGLTRAAARRYLLTLKALEYVDQAGSQFSLTPRVLELGFTFLSTMSVTSVARPFMEQVVDALREPCSVSVLDERDVVYIARATPAKRLVSSTLAVGSRLPAHCTSMGKVLLAAMSPDRLDAFFAGGPLKPMTGRTICSEAKLREALAEVRLRGWAWNDGESEEGIRSVSAPILDRSGRVHAAINVAGLASRVSIKELRSRFVPAVVDAGAAISRALGADPQRLQRRILDHDFRQGDR